MATATQDDPAELAAAAIIEYEAAAEEHAQYVAREMAREGIVPDGLDEAHGLIEAALEPLIEGIGYSEYRDEYGHHIERDVPASVTAGEMAQAVLLALYQAGYNVEPAIPAVPARTPVGAGLNMIELASRLAGMPVRGAATTGGQ